MDFVLFIKELQPIDFNNQKDRNLRPIELLFAKTILKRLSLYRENIGQNKKTWNKWKGSIKGSLNDIKKYINFKFLFILNNFKK